MSAVWQQTASTARLADAAIVTEIDLAHPSNGFAFRFSSPSTGSIAAHLLGVRFGGGSRDAASMPVDSYVRGADLVATYEESPPRQLRAQCYWRHLLPEQFATGFKSGVVAAFDLILSVNTSLLANNPHSDVQSTIFGATEVISLRRDQRQAIVAEPLALNGQSVSISHESSEIAAGGTGAFIVRWNGEKSNSAVANRSWIQMVHPSDFCRASAGAVGDLSTAAAASADRSTSPTGVQIVHDLFHQSLEKGVILRARVRGAIVDRQQDEAIAIAAYQQFAAAEPPLTV